LHQSQADEKRFRQNAITRLQEEQSKIQNRLDRLYDNRLDGFIEPEFFERKAGEWRQTHDYVQDGVRLLELSKKAYCLFKQQNSSEKWEIVEFRLFELDLEGSNSHCNLPPTL
jgi:hypothetical protein